MYIYIYIYIYTHVYYHIYIYTYIYIMCVWPSPPGGPLVFLGVLRPVACAAAVATDPWPLQEIRSFQSFLALVNHRCIAPSICIAHTIALLWYE